MAVGEALGAPLEGLTPEEIESKVGRIDGFVLFAGVVAYTFVLVRLAGRSETTPPPAKKSGEGGASGAKPASGSPAPASSKSAGAKPAPAKPAGRRLGGSKPAPLPPSDPGPVGSDPLSDVARASGARSAYVEQWSFTGPWGVRYPGSKHAVVHCMVKDSALVASIC